MIIIFNCRCFFDSFGNSPHFNFLSISIIFNVCPKKEILQIDKLLEYQICISHFICFYYFNIVFMLFKYFLPIQFLPLLLPISWLQWRSSHSSRKYLFLSPINEPQVSCGTKSECFFKNSQHQYRSTVENKNYRYHLSILQCVINIFLGTKWIIFYINIPLTSPNKTSWSM